MLLSVLLLCSLFLISLHIYFRYSYAGRLLAKIPGPKPLHIVGHAFELMSLPKDQIFGFLRNLPKKYGTVVKLHGFNYRSVHIYEPNDIEVLWSSIHRFEKKLPYTFLTSWLGDGLIVSNGDKWLNRRKLLTSSFHFKILKQFFQVFVEQTEKFLDEVEIEVKKKQSDAIITKATIKIMMETSMGLTVRDYENPAVSKYCKALQTMGQSIVERLTKIWLYIGFLFYFSKTYRVQKEALKDLHRFTKQIIDDRCEYRKNNKCLETNDKSIGIKSKLAFMDMLLEMEIAGKIDEAGIKEEVDTFMFANTIYEELHRVFGNSERTPTLEDLNELKYLECCIKESLRLYPSVPFTARYTKEEVVLSGYKIPPKTIIVIHPYDVHRRPELFPDPEKFIPERFLPENIGKRHHYAYIPFSAGPRNCIGQKFAMLELKTMMSGLLRRFRLEPVTKDHEIHYICDTVLRPSRPIYVRFCKRKLFLGQIN